MTLPDLLFIDGRFRSSSSGRRTTLINPATEEPFAEIAAAELVDVNVAVESARRAWESGLSAEASSPASGWRDLAPGKRTEILFNVARKLREHIEDIA